MKILVPIDGSDASERALRFAADLSQRFGGSLRVVHISDAETDATDQILERARDILSEAGVDEEPEVEIDVDLGFRSAEQVGEDILDLVDDDGYDHVVMGHHGEGMVDRAILGSAAETVLRANEIPVTVVP